MTTSLKYLVPISCFLFVGSVAWPLLWLSVVGRPTMLPVESIGNRVQQAPVVSAPLPAHPHPHDHDHDHDHGHGPGQHTHEAPGHTGQVLPAPGDQDVTLNTAAPRGGR